VVFVTDQGSHFRTRNAEYKRSCHDASVRIPLVISGPGFDQGRRAPELASLIDLPPTICDIAGRAAPEPMMGRSLRPLAAGPVNDWRDDVFIQLSEAGIGRAVRTERWKYCVTAPDQGVNGGSEVYLETHLYDLWADPHELTNLVGRGPYRAVADELQQRLRRRMAEAGESDPKIVPARHL
jgi:arylsulfatase A-like enzyme